MIIFYPTRNKARQNKPATGKVVDCKDKPSDNGSRWGVQVNRRPKSSKPTM